MPRITTFLFASLISVTPALAQDTKAGQQVFMDLCATCHGVDARGFGPMAAVLTLQPSDLTALAKDNGGTFPTGRVVGRIDGRDPLVSHGSPMPVFGRYFEGEDASLKTQGGQPILTSQPIVDLVGWLESIQE